ncbi:hypothetical protein ACFWJT_05830 [Streptomyces sp. NPDC127069]
MDKREQTTPTAASKAGTSLGRAVLVNVIGKAIWALLVKVIGDDA